MDPKIDPNKLLNERDAAGMLGTTPGTLNVWRARGPVKIPFVKVGRSVRYRYGDLVAFIAANTCHAPMAEAQ